MEKAIIWLLAAIVLLAVALGIYWLLWCLWCWILPQVWAGGPSNIIAPGYWLFAGCWTLISLLGKAVFGRTESK